MKLMPSASPTTQPAAYAPPSGTLAFAWPVSGPIISDYGASLSGERNAGINIATFHVGRDAAGGSAIALIEVDGEVPADVLAKVQALPQVQQAKPLRF